MPRKRDLLDVPNGTRNPIDAAVSGRDAVTMATVTEAIRHNEVHMAFQPVIQARLPSTVAFYEGLLRVLDAAGRVIPAGQFMARAEQTELGRELDCIALQRGFKVLSEFRQLRLSINMSARSIGYRKWMRVLDRGLRDDPDAGERLILEISEDSAMIVPELVTKFMGDMQARGVSFALDDYGAGSIAIRHFRQFLFDAVKIDGQFVRGITNNPSNQLVVTALMRVAREFDMFTVAESVETEMDAAFLTDAGVDCLQGYRFGAPTIAMPWLPENNARTAT